MMSEEELRQIELRARAASEEWLSERGDWLVMTDEVGRFPRPFAQHFDALFMTHARVDVLRLVDEVHCTTRLVLRATLMAQERGELIAFLKMELVRRIASELGEAPASAAAVVEAMVVAFADGIEHPGTEQVSTTR